MTSAAEDHILRHLASLGLADLVAGKLVAGSIVDPASTVSGTTQSTLYTVNTATIPSGYFGKRGHAALIVAFGTTAGNANAKDLALLLGATTVVTKVGTTNNAKDYVFAVLVISTGVDAQIAVGLLISDTAVLATTVTGLTLDDGADIVATVKAQNTAAAAASATGKGLTITLLG